jgi:hypothetical protein
VVAYGGTLQLSLHKDGAGLPPQGRTVRAGAALPPGGARLLFSPPFSCALRRESLPVAAVITSPLLLLPLWQSSAGVSLPRHPSTLFRPGLNVAVVRAQSVVPGVHAGLGRERDRLGQPGE